MLTEEAYETFDKDGAATYYYRSGDTSFADHDEAAAHARFDELFAELDDAEVICFDKADSSAAVTLPPYEYPGPELFYTVVYQYIIDEFSQHYDEADVGIPCPIIVAEDFSDKNDLRLWGDFTYINYELDGDVLESVSGGSYPGLMHIKDTGDGYEVTGIDVVKDGSEFTESAKEIFGKYFEDYLEASADEEGRDAIRAQIIANYAAANGLNITAFHDYGWEPVPLPEENIDSFYSDLD